MADDTTTEPGVRLGEIYRLLAADTRLPGQPRGSLWQVTKGPKLKDGEWVVYADRVTPYDKEQISMWIPPRLLGPRFVWGDENETEDATV